MSGVYLLSEDVYAAAATLLLDDAARQLKEHDRLCHDLDAGLSDADLLLPAGKAMSAD